MRISDWSSDVCSSDLVSGAAPDWRAPQTLDALANGTGTVNPFRINFSAVERQMAEVVQTSATLETAVRGGCDHGLLLRLTVSRVNPCRLQTRSEEHTSELQSLMRLSYAVFCLKKK